MADNYLVSIVVLTKNGGALFQDSIKMIFSQNVPFLYEVIIVDSGSTDGTLEFLKDYPIRIFHINPKDFSFGPTRDFGFSQAKGDFIVTLSQDVIPADENWLRNLIIPLLDDETDIVQGHCKVPIDNGVFFWERRGMFYFTSEGKQFCESYGRIGLSFTNIAIKKSVWEEVKCGDSLMCEDKAFQKKAYLKGYKFSRSNQAFAYHGHTYNLRSLIKRCENEGMGWRHAEVKYSFNQMLKDLKQEKYVYGVLLKNIFKGEIKHLSEILFLLIRPIFLYKGNKFNKKYVY